MGIFINRLGFGLVFPETPVSRFLAVAINLRPFMAQMFIMSTKPHDAVTFARSYCWRNNVTIRIGRWPC